MASCIVLHWIVFVSAVAKLAASSGNSSVAVASRQLEEHNCSNLPVSMNGNAYPLGCPGAVYGSGIPSQSYCEGKQGSWPGKYPWWSACCLWSGSECKPKDEISYDCAALPLSMNGPSQPSGCPGAVFSDGTPSQRYCEGKDGEYPWWSSCCKWDGSQCKSKDEIEYNCSKPPQSMNGPSHPAGCLGAVWSNGVPSRKYCAGNDGKHQWWSACCKWDVDQCRPKEEVPATVYTDCAASGENGWCGLQIAGTKQQCVCKDKEISFCRAHCESDPKCQGFVKRGPWAGSTYCMMPMKGQIDKDYCSAIDASCYIHNQGHDVDEELKCTSSGNHKGYAGCFIKKHGYIDCAARGSKGWCGLNPGTKQQCTCRNKDISFCRDHCENDANCQGYVKMGPSRGKIYCMMPMRGEIGSDYCQNIDKDCYHSNLGRNVDEEVQCSTGGRYYGGCFIKNGGSRRLQAQGSKPDWVLV